jgi:hypothetical protein
MVFPERIIRYLMLPIVQLLEVDTTVLWPP